MFFFCTFCTSSALEQQQNVLIFAKLIKQLLYEHGYSFNFRRITATDESGRTVLHWACSGGRAEIVRWLLERGSNPNIPDDSRWTPLIIACSAGHEPCVQLLIGAGAQIDSCTDQGRSSLLYSCSKNHQSIAKKLLNEGADVNLQDKLGATPLHRAAGCGHSE
jgi:26S proteasome non-ATPase regulatory subunit 10